MTPTHLQKVAEKFEIQAYKRPRDIKELRKTHVPFTGSPQKHPHDRNRVILISDPYSTYTSFFEFLKKDISYIEELPNLVNLEGDAILMVRIWVKKRSIAVRSTAFMVEDTTVG